MKIVLCIPCYNFPIMPANKPKLKAILQALLVTFLWATSWVLVKFGLDDLPPITFAGLRYFSAFLALLIVFLRSPQKKEMQSLMRKDWLALAGLGLVYYTLTQGTQFLGLLYLPAVLFSFLLNFTALATALLGWWLLKEGLSKGQWLGVVVFLVGVVVFFYPVLIPSGLGLGMGIGLFSMLANSFASILGRMVNRRGNLSALAVTVVSMGIGSVVLLAAGLLTEDFPQLSLSNWGIILWLALVNTALAFTLWNQSLRTLTAAESSMINNTMLVQIALLAWVFLGERPGLQEWAGMLVATAGVLLLVGVGETKD